MVALKSELCLGFVILALSAGLCLAAVPSSLGRDLPPAELIANGLPAKMTIEGARKSDLLSAVCSAVRKHRKSGAGITAAAVAARREWAGDIVGTVLRCAGRIDCEYVGAIVKAAVSARPEAATAMSDAAMARSPDCEEAIQAPVRAGAKSEDARVKTSSPTPSEESHSRANAGMDEGFDPHERLSQVCDSGTQRVVRASQLADFLRSHPDAAMGPCPSNPSPSPVASRAPSPPIVGP